MKKQPEATDIAMQIMKLQTSWVDYIGDEQCYSVGAVVPNGDYRTNNRFEVRLNEATITPAAIKHGGIAIWSNLRPQTLRRAVLVGLEMMFRSGQMDLDDFVEGSLDAAGD